MGNVSLSFVQDKLDNIPINELKLLTNLQNEIMSEPASGFHIHWAPIFDTVTTLGLQICCIDTCEQLQPMFEDTFA